MNKRKQGQREQDIFNAETVEIHLSNSSIKALVCRRDYALICAMNWCLHPDGYVVSNQVRMHRIILNAPAGIEVDHLNHVRHDNRRNNLRLATKAQNQHNRRKLKPASSRFKGVFLKHKYHRWQAFISVEENFNGRNHRQKHLGYFDTEIEAAIAYNKAAIELRGSRALLNSI